MGRGWDYALICHKLKLGIYISFSEGISETRPKLYYKENSEEELANLAQFVFEASSCSVDVEHSEVLDRLLDDEQYKLATWKATVFDD